MYHSHRSTKDLVTQISPVVSHSVSIDSNANHQKPPHDVYRTESIASSASRSPVSTNSAEGMFNLLQEKVHLEQQYHSVAANSAYSQSLFPLSLSIHIQKEISNISSFPLFSILSLHVRHSNGVQFLQKNTGQCNHNRHRIQFKKSRTIPNQLTVPMNSTSQPTPHKIHTALHLMLPFQCTIPTEMVMPLPVRMSIPSECYICRGQYLSEIIYIFSFVFHSGNGTNFR